MSINSSKKNKKKQTKIEEIVPVDASIEKIREILGEQTKHIQVQYKEKNQMDIFNSMQESLEERIKRLKETLDIKSLISNETGLSFKRNTLEQCPFCQSGTGKHSAFFVSKGEHDYFKCFSCQKGGDVIKFVQLYRKKTAKESVDYLDTPNNTPKPIKKKRPTKQEICDEDKVKAAQKTYEYYSSKLTKEKAAKFLSSEKRQFGHLTQKAADILISNAKFNDFRKKNDKTSEKQGIIFPVRNNRNQIVAYQKIGLTKQSKRNGGKISWGYWEVNKEDYEKEEIVICESIANTLACAAIGYRSICVFTSGCEKQINLIKQKYPNEKIVLWLDKGTREKEIAEKLIKNYQIYGAFFEEEKPKSYDVNDLLIEKKENFDKTAHLHIKNAKSHQKLVFKEPNKKSYSDIADMSESIKNLCENEIFLFSAPTGTGKTHLIADEVIRMVLQNQSVTIFTNSIKGVDSIIEEIEIAAKKQMMDNIHISRNVSTTKQSEGEKVFKKHKISQIAVSTYYYLGRQGHLAETYDIAEKLIKDRIVFCDEIQALIDTVSKINIPLSSRYKKNKKTYYKIKKCPFKRYHTGCESCIMGYKMEDSKQSTKIQKFHDTIETDWKHVSTSKELRISNFGDGIWDIKNYSNDEGIFNKMLDEKVVYRQSEITEKQVEEYNQKEIFESYIHHLMQTLKYPQISMVSPIRKDDGDFVRPSEILAEEKTDRKKIFIAPNYACQIPHLKGFDLLPLIQLLDAKKIIMCSATIPKETEKILSDVLENRKDWSIKKDYVDKVPIKFKSTFLYTEKSLSSSLLAKITDDIDYETLVVAKTKEASKLLYDSLVNKKDAEIFMDNIYFDTEIRRGRGSKYSSIKKKTITHVRSSLLTGINRPDKVLMIIDCNSFYPQIVCTSRDRAGRIKEMIEQLNTLIIQAIGRLLRSDNQECRRTGIDDRQIVFLLHGLSYELKIDPRLFWEQKTVSEKFVTDNNPKNSIISAIKEAIKGEEIRDYRLIEKMETVHKACKKGKESIGPTRRRKIDSDDYRDIKLQMKIQRLEKKALIFQGSWREFYKKNNLDREKKNVKKILRQVFAKK